MNTSTPRVPPSPLPRNAWGKVWLVGAGPGDPELLTLKAVSCLQRADVVFVDDLVNPEVLHHATPRARVVWVGKRGGCASTPQAFIERAMVHEATQGREVVRLKGGDPMIFGRGGEELTALRTAGVTAEVVNGITSGLAAVTGMGCALTHRSHAQGVVLLTGHSHRPGQGPDWCQVGQAMASLHLTLVVYMGVGQLASIAHGLSQSLPGHTPAALVQHASLPQQRQWLTPLGTLAQTAQAAGVSSPAVVVVGHVLSGLAKLQPQPARHSA